MFISISEMPTIISSLIVTVLISVLVFTSILSGANNTDNFCATWTLSFTIIDSLNISHIRIPETFLQANFSMDEVTRNCLSSNNNNNNVNNIFTIQITGKVSKPIIISSKSFPSTILDDSRFTLRLNEISFDSSLKFRLPVASFPPNFPFAFENNETSLIVVEDGFRMNSLLIESCKYSFGESLSNAEHWLVSHFVYAPSFKGRSITLRNNEYKVKNAKNFDVYFNRTVPSRKLSYFLLRWCYLRTVASSHQPQQDILVENNNINIEMILDTIDYEARMFEQTSLIHVIGENENENSLVSTVSAHPLIQNNVVRLIWNKMPARPMVDRTMYFDNFADEAVPRMHVSLVNVMAKDIKIVSTVQRNEFYFGGDTVNSVLFLAVNCTTFWYPVDPLSVVHRRTDLTTLPPSELYIRDNFGDAKITGLSMRNAIIFCTTQFMRQPPAVYGDGAFKNYSTFYMIGTMSYVKTAHVKRNSWSVDQNCFSSNKVKVPSVEKVNPSTQEEVNAASNRDLYYSVGCHCSSIFTYLVYAVLSDHNEWALRDRLMILADPSMRSSLRLNYRFGEYVIEGNSWSDRLFEQVDAGSVKQHLKAYSYFAFAEPMHYRYDTLTLHNNTITKLDATAMFCYYAFFEIGLQINSNNIFNMSIQSLIQDRSKLSIGELHVTSNRALDVKTEGERGTFIGLSIHTATGHEGTVPMKFDTVNLTNNDFFIRSISVNNSEGDIGLFITFHDFTPMMKSLIMNGNKLRGTLACVHLSVSRIALLSTPITAASQQPHVVQRGIGMEVDGSVECSNNILDFKWGSPGPIWMAVIQSPSRTIIKKNFIISNNIVLGSLLSRAFQFEFFSMKAGPSTPRQFVVRSAKLDVGQDVIVNNNTLIVTGPIQPFDLSAILPPMSFKSNPALVAGIFSLRDSFKAQSVMMDGNHVHLDVTASDPQSSPDTNAPAVFASIFLTELSTSLQVASSIDISSSSVTVIVSTSLPSFDDINVRGTIFAVYPLPAPIPESTPVFSLIEQNVFISHCSVHMANGVGTLMSLCREGPVSDLPAEDLLGMMKDGNFLAFPGMVQRILRSASPMFCSTDSAPYSGDPNVEFYSINTVAFAARNLRIEHSQTVALDSETDLASMRSYVLSAFSSLYDSSSFVAFSSLPDLSSYSTSSSSNVRYEFKGKGTIMNLPSIAFKSPSTSANSLISTSIVIEQSSADSFSLIPVDLPGSITRVDSQRASWEVRCSHFDVAEAKRTVCHNVPKCLMPSCIPTKTISQTPFSRTASLRPLCDPGITLVPFTEKTLKRNKFRDLDAKILKSGRPFFVRVQLLADWDEYQFTKFSPTFSLTTSIYDDSSENSNNNNNQQKEQFKNLPPTSLLPITSATLRDSETKEPIPFRIVSSNRTGLLSFDVELVVTESFSEYTTAPELFICLNNLERKDKNMIFECDVPMAGASGVDEFPDKICTSVPFVFPRRWSGIAPSATLAISGSAVAAAAGAPIAMTVLAGGRPASLTSAVALQRQNFIMSMLDCSQSDSSDLEFLASPFGLSIGRETGQYLRGAAVGNTLILIITLVFGLGLTAYRSQNVRNAQFASDMKEMNSNRNNFAFHRSRHSQLRAGMLSNHQQSRQQQDNGMIPGATTLASKSKRSRTAAGVTAKSFGGLSPEEAKNVPLFHPKFQAESSFPNRLFVFLIVILHGTIMSGFALIFFLEDTDATDVILGLIALTMPIILIGYTSYGLFPKDTHLLKSVLVREAAPKKFQPRSFGCFSVVRAVWWWLVEESVAWRSKSRLANQQEERKSNKNTKSKNMKKNFFIPYFVERFGDAFVPTLPCFYWFIMFHDVGVTVVLAIVSATTPEPGSFACYLNQVVAALLIGLSFLLCSLFPLFSRIENFFLFSCSFGTVLSLCFVLASTYSTDKELKRSLFDVADGFDATINILCVLKLILDVTVFAETFSVSSKHKNWIRKFLEKKFPKSFPKRGKNQNGLFRNDDDEDDDDQIMLSHEEMKNMSPQEIIAKIEEKKKKRLERQQRVDSQMRGAAQKMMMIHDDGEPLDEGEEITINDLRDDVYDEDRKSGRRHKTTSLDKNRKNVSHWRNEDSYYDSPTSSPLVSSSSSPLGRRKPSSAVELSDFLRHSVGSFSSSRNLLQHQSSSQSAQRTSSSARTRREQQQQQQGQRRPSSSSAASPSTKFRSPKVYRSSDGKTSVVPQSYKRYALL